MGCESEGVREEYPTLSGEYVEFAKLCTVAYPRIGDQAQAKLLLDENLSQRVRAMLRAPSGWS
jgi:hypothetical protein